MGQFEIKMNVNVLVESVENNSELNLATTC